MSNLFSKKVKFTTDEQQVIALLGNDGIYFDPGNKEHKRLKSAMSNLFFMGILDRGDKALNHFVINTLGKKAVEYNELVDKFNSNN